MLHKTLYTLGFIYYFDFGDAETAKLYFDMLYERAPTSEFTIFAKGFYDGESFLALDRLPMLVEMEQRAADEAQRKAEEEQRVAEEAQRALEAEENIPSETDEVQSEESP